jgi:hypothetical protein
MITDDELRERLIPILGSVLEKTLNGQVDWSPTNRDDQFLSSGPNSSLRVSSWLDDELDENITFSLLNTRGVEVAELSSRWNFDGESGPASWNSKLIELHRAARRTALQVDKVLDSVLSDLGSGQFQRNRHPSEGCARGECCGLSPFSG